MFDYTENMCVICRVPFSEKGDKLTLTTKGIETLKQYSSLHGDNDLHEFLLGQQIGVNVHVSCRKKFTDKRRYEQLCESGEGAACSVPPKTLRSSVSVFDWKLHCFFCGEQVTYDKYSHNSLENVTVRTLEIRETILLECSKRIDSWSLQIQSRLNMCHDLVAAEAVYHKSCRGKFSKIKSSSHDDKSDFQPSTSFGRPENPHMAARFVELCEWLENADDELYTMTEVHEKLRSLSDLGEDVYSMKHLKRKLEEKYGDHVFFAEIRGRKNVLCLRNMASCIINDKWYNDRNGNIADDSTRIVATAAKLVHAQMRESLFEMNEYPVCSAFSNIDATEKWIPSLLLTFIANVVKNELKRIAICHSIVQAARPKSCISPILFGVGVSLDHMFGSRLLLDVLARLGFSITHDEVGRYKQSIVQCNHLDLPNSYAHSFTQWSGDNVDHNLKTLDGTGTFHGMGIISMSTPCNRLDLQGHFLETPIKRTKRCSISQLSQNCCIPIQYYCAPDKASLSLLRLKPLSQLLCHSSYAMPPSVKLDVLYHVGWFFTTADKPRPSWAGFMHDICPPSDVFPPSSDIRMLPIIDLNPNDMSCIYSTLLFIERQSKHLNLETACVTFDQPLWLKAVEIVMTKEMNVVCRLGAFHVIMSFLGSIGKIMEGSGLVEALQCCYGPNAVTHMISGKAVDRAIRGHFLTESALFVLFLKNQLMSHEGNEVILSDLTSQQMSDLKYLYEDALNKSSPFTESGQLPECFEKLICSINNAKQKLLANRTAKLWLQYLEYIGLLKMFIRAERTGDWHLHLNCISRMLNLFAATGHTNYAKSARLYLQQMSDLPNTSPWLYQQFSAGHFHSVRRSDRFWAGLSTDLVIEQTMMRAIKSRGGLTHGRGMSESVRLQWVSSMHKFGMVQCALTSLTGLDDSSDERAYADTGKSRRKRDQNDFTKLYQWFEASDPFRVTDGRLHSLSTGKAASDSDGVNCDIAEDVGSQIMTKLDGMSFGEIVLRKVDRCKTLAHVSTRKCKILKRIQIDGNALFSRLIVVMQRCANMESYFKYELTAEPTSLFKDTALRKADKSVLARQLRTKMQCSVPSAVISTYYVVDGGWLLHRIKWQQGFIFARILEQYIEYIARHFASIVNIVFDGYENGASTKDHEHEKRSLNASPDFVFDENKPCISSQAAFLANESNKKSFVDVLICKLKIAGHRIQQALHDADTLIVKTSLEIAHHNPVIVVANDTDVLVLLVHHFKYDMSDIYLRSDNSQKDSATKKIISIREIRDSIGKEAAEQILVLHAISGCDTTSALYGIGKGRAWHRLIGNNEAFELSQIISNCHTSHNDVLVAGLRLLVLLYGGKTTDSLNHLRYVMYMNYAASSSMQTRSERLPPTENAARFHIYRVHLQTVEWKSLMAVEMKPEDWGWKITDGRYVPITTDIDAAPDDLLNIVRCKCNMETQRPCSTQLCSCLRHGLSCVAACKNCTGELCGNVDSTVDCTFNDNEDDSDHSDQDDYEELIPDDCLSFDIPWIDEEVVETDVS